MKLNVSKILLKKSDVENKAPAASALTSGEITLNYNADRPFLSFKDSNSGVTKFYRDMFVVNIVSGSGDQDEVIYTADSATTKYINALKINIAEEYCKNGIILRYRNKLYLPDNTEPTDVYSRNIIAFSRIDVLDDGTVKKSTFTYDYDDDYRTFPFVYNETEVKLKNTLDGYRSLVGDEETDPLNSRMTNNEAFATLAKVITDNELTVAAAVNALNDRIDDLQAQIDDLQSQIDSL